MKKTTSLIIISIIAAIFYPLSPQAFEKKFILASIPPVASLVKMVAGDLAEVESIQNKSTCPHHYSLKPSDAKKINDADYIILIDRSFDASFFKAAKNSSALKIEIAKFKDLEIKDGNLHIWLGYKNAKIILQGLREVLISMGFDKNIIDNNYNIALNKILFMQSSNSAKSDEKIVVIGENLKYLLSDISSNEIYFFPKIVSLKKISELENIIKTNNPKCIIHDSNIKIDQLNYNKNLNFIELDSENWGEIGDYKEYYINYLSYLYSRINHCFSK